MGSDVRCFEYGEHMYELNDFLVILYRYMYNCVIDIFARCQTLILDKVINKSQYRWSS